MDIKTAIKEGTNILKDNHIVSAQLDAELLLASAIGESRKYIILNHNLPLEDKYLKSYKDLIKKRSLKKPIAYLINKKFFWNYEFFVNKSTLIPRPDTELIIEKVLDLTKSKDKMRVLDIGVGSGCILLSILKERKNFYGTGIDICKNCIKISKINATKLSLSQRVKFFKSDVDKFFFGKYDLIVSNPPYISKNNLKYLDNEIVDYEPIIALNGGLDGLSEIRKVVKKSSELIKKNGKLILEIGFDQKNKVLKLLKKEGFYKNNTYQDLAKNDRCIVSTKI